MYRRYRIPSIWQEMNRLQREMNRIFGTYSPAASLAAPSYPPINIWADENNALITVEIPGVDKGDLDVNVTGDTLTLSGERKLDEIPNGAQFHRQERSYGKFNRSVQMPYTVDVQKVKATFKNGLLKIELPRVEAEKPKKIAVKLS